MIPRDATSACDFFVFFSAPIIARKRRLPTKETNRSQEDARVVVVSESSVSRGRGCLSEMPQMLCDDEREGKPVFGQNVRRGTVDTLWKKKLIAPDDPPRYGVAFGINRAKTLIDASRLWPLTPPRAGLARGLASASRTYRDIDIAKSIFFPESASLTRHRPIDRPVTKSYLRAVEKRCGRFVSISLRSEGWEIVFLDNPGASSSAPRQNGLWVDVYQCRWRQNQLSTNSWIGQKLQFD